MKRVNNNKFSSKSRILMKKQISKYNFIRKMLLIFLDKHQQKTVKFITINLNIFLNCFYLQHIVAKVTMYKVIDSKNSSKISFQTNNI